MRVFDSETVERLIRLTADASQAIMEIYARADLGVETKDDNSPLTLADKASHEVISAGLAEITPDITVVSEEGKQPTPASLKKKEQFWLVDPLDGTKEFIKRNGEFTVNLGLIKNGRPVFGIIAAPVHETLWCGDLIAGEAFRMEGDDTRQPIRARAVSDEGLTVVGSRSHVSDSETEFLAGDKVKQRHGVGSSLKFCMIADGAADIYVRFGRTMEWDTAAGQAILEAAGGHVSLPNGQPLGYTKKDLANDDGFIARGL